MSTTRGVTAFVNTNVIPMDRDRILGDHTVVVEEDRIRAVGPSPEVVAPEGAVVVDGTGHYLIPGLADMHYHVSDEERSLLLAVANGQTTVQALNVTPTELVWSADIGAGERFGPRLITAPHALGLPAVTAFAAKRFDGAVAPLFTVNKHIEGLRPPGYSFQVDAESARAFVRFVHEAGADAIKTNLYLGREAFDAIVRSAAELDMKVLGHVWGDIGLEHYIRSGAQVHHFGEIAPYLCTNAVQGVPVQEYDFLAIDERLPQLIEIVLESGMWFTPTANLLWYVVENYANLEHLTERPRTRYVPPQKVADWRNPKTNFVYIAFGTDEARLDRAKRYLDAQRRVLNALHEAGVPLLAGTDSGAAPGSVEGFDLPLELELLVECGLTPFEALAAATRNPAEFIGEGGNWGTIGVGRNADLVLLRSNPLDDITRTADIDGVMLGGRWLPRGELDAMLDGVAAVLRSDDQQTQSGAQS